MSFFITLVASDKKITPAHISGVERYLETQGIALDGQPSWLDPHIATDIPVADKLTPAHMAALREALSLDKIDVFITPAASRFKKLVIADMDSTIVVGETLDELAAEAGIKDKIAAITARAMNGELDFKGALRERVGLLKDLPESAIHKTRDNIKLNKGAELFIHSMAQKGAICILVSGGFTVFTQAIAKKAGFHHSHGNILDIEDGKLTGEVIEPILDRDTKLQLLEHYMKELNIAPEETLAIGDGANDLDMLSAAGLGIGFHPKPILKESLDNCILHGDLTAALYMQGFGYKQKLH